jgi:hypothetical protein
LLLKESAPAVARRRVADEAAAAFAGD